MHRAALQAAFRAGGMVLLLAAAAQAAAAAGEQPAPPDRFVLTADDGTRYTGPLARIDIRHLRAGAPPGVEISFHAVDERGASWAALVLADAGFLRTLALQATVSDQPLRPGSANVQRGDAVGQVQVAQAGTVQLALNQGRLAGRAAAAGLATLQFSGPYAISCTVPASVASAAATGAAPPASPGDALAQRVDEHFETDLCRPYQALGRRQ